MFNFFKKKENKDNKYKKLYPINNIRREAHRDELFKKISGILRRKKISNRKSKIFSLQEVKMIGVRVSLVLLVAFSFVFFKPHILSIISTTNLFNIEEIEIIGCRVVNKEKIREIIDIKYHTSMLSFDTGKAEQELVRQPWIKHAELRKSWPSKVVIIIKEYSPEAIVVGEGVGDGKLYYFSSHGVVYSEVPQGGDVDFPIITGMGISDDEKNKKVFEDILVFLSRAKRNNPNLPVQNISELHIDQGGELVVFLADVPFPIYFGKGMIKEKFRRLSKVMKELYKKRRGKKIISNIAYIKVDYLENKVLVAQK